MKIASLGSGSKGNATLISDSNTTIIVDCGFSIKKLELRAEELNFDLASLTAIFVTHEHSDHISGVAKLAKKYSLPVYLTLGSLKSLQKKIAKDFDHSLFNIIHDGLSVSVGQIKVLPVTVPHDCSEPVQFIFESLETQKQWGVLTDIGHVSSHVIEAYSGLDGLLLEFNYDQAMLQNGVYPYHLKQRVSGDYGHLSNDQSLSLLDALDTQKLTQLIIGHISENNNSPQIIETIFQQNSFTPKPILATQSEGFDWICL